MRAERHRFGTDGRHFSVDCPQDVDAERVGVESATIHDLAIKVCPLCMHPIEDNAWYVLGETTDQCMGCWKPLGPQHVICPGCGAHVTRAVA